MKKFFLLFILIFFGLLNNTYATINSSIILSGTTNLGTSGKIVFPNTNKGVIVNASSLEINIASNIAISGNFWIEKTSSSNDQSFGWATFDIGTVPGVPKVVLKNNLDNTFTFEGFAWSKAAGWIYFGDTGVTDISGKVIYNRGAGKVNGCGWSQNLGWICLDGFNLDTTPPDLSSFPNIFVANHNKEITVSDTDFHEIEVRNWKNTSNSIYSLSSFNHDFRKAQTYNFKITDTSFNSSTGIIKVVAGNPSKNLTDGGIGLGAKASIFNSNDTNIIYANGIDPIDIDFYFADTYGNSIIKETGIKNVNVEIGVDNNVDLDQVNNKDFGDAISFSNNQFGLSFGFQSTGVGYSSNADYSLDIFSLAPTKAGYDFTSNDNDIKINNIKLIVTDLTGNLGVGEGIFQTFNSNINKNFKFFPSVYIDEICADSNCVDKNSTTTQSWNIITNVETNFNGKIKIDSPKNISLIKIAHLLDTQDNNFVSFQDLKLIYGGTFGGTGSLIPNANNTNCTYQPYSSSYNASPYSSSIITNYGSYNNGNYTLTDNFNATPKIVLGGVSDYDVKYSSVIEYNTNGTHVKYPSFYYSDLNSIVDNQIKIAGIAVDNNIYTFTDENSINKIGKLSKMELIANIEKNISGYRKSGKGVGNYFDIGGVRYIKNPTSGSYLLNSWPIGINTIIVDGGDLLISGNIKKSGNEINSIIVLEGNDSVKGNIWIKNNVQRIEAVLFTDKSILSGDGNNIYSENFAKDQLFIKGSIISYNTIGGASSAIPKCPYYLTSCNFTIAKQYDLNNFRYYINIIQGNPVPGLLTTTSGYDKASIVIEYDPLIQINIPKIFSLGK